MHEAKEKFGLHIGRRGSIGVVSRHVKACYGETGEMLSLDRHMGLIFAQSQITHMCFHLPMCALTLFSQNYITSQKLTRASVKAFLQINTCLSISPFLMWFSKMRIKTEMENQPLTTFASSFFFSPRLTQSLSALYLSMDIKSSSKHSHKTKTSGQKHLIWYGCINESTAMI